VGERRAVRGILVGKRKGCRHLEDLVVDVGITLRLPYFPACKTHRPIRHTMIFSFEILEKNNDECILILVIYWKKTGLLLILLHESKLFTSSDARSHDLDANFTISQ
jgi:hypothetical protein